MAGRSPAATPSVNSIPSVYLQAVREKAGQHVFDSLGGLPRQAQTQALVDAAVGVGQLCVETIDRRGEGHRLGAPWLAIHGAHPAFGIPVSGHRGGDGVQPADLIR